MIEFPALIIKPDAIKQGLDVCILRDLENAGFKIRFRKIMQLSDVHLPYIYPDKIDNDRRPFALFSISHDISMILILEGEGGHQRLIHEKGNWQSDHGIRQRYKLYSKEDLEHQGMKGDELEYHLCQNRIHSADDQYQTALLLAGVLRSDEIEKLKDFSLNTFLQVRNMLAIQKL